MNGLSKISEVTNRYDVTARTLHYYEKMGLIESTRCDSSGYRLYDETAIVRLKQILILRKMNISIKDIKQIFASSDSDVVLNVLSKKADDIDSEVALLHELKEIVLEFIRQIKQIDFHNEAEVKKLYENVETIEAQLVSGEYNGSATSVNRLVEVAEKLDDKRLTPPIAVNTYRQSIAPMRFIGKKYKSGAVAWPDFHANGHNDLLLENLTKKLNVDLKDLYEEGDSLIGLMCHRNGFEYWLGYFTPENTPVPDGFEHEDFSGKDIATCWLYGKTDEVFAVEPVAYEKLLDEGFAPIDDWWFERYHPTRTVPDKKGYMIIDICFFANKVVDAKKTESFKQQIDGLVYGTENLINLETMVPGTNRSDLIGKAGQEVKMVDSELIICAQGDLDCMQTAETFTFPLRIDTVAKISNEHIRMYFNMGTLNLNWDENLYFCDVLSGKPYIYPGFGRVSADEYHHISWIIHPEFMAILVDGKLRFASNEFQYVHMLRTSPQTPVDCVRIGTAWGSTITVKSLTVTPIIC